ncbi:hypothetical protein L2E82_28587 [Cichorium intybus]|uniref:Uncharacterized protein n=1 Tax=Cichorium intybus TaxID=13427 RepID=A0ACB9CWI9_CICIN|nr:hypothetical protein L2E82_28587 [Cichorium intybus]
MKSSQLMTEIDPSVGVTAGMEDLGEVKVNLIERGKTGVNERRLYSWVGIETGETKGIERESVYVEDREEPETEKPFATFKRKLSPSS